MEPFLRPAASEVRSMLQKIKLDNIANGRLISPRVETAPVSRQFNEWQTMDELQPISRFDCNTSTLLPKYGFGPKTQKGIIAPGLTLNQFLKKCRKKLDGLEPPNHRQWMCVEPKDATSQFLDNKLSLRILQWNVLSQTLGTKNDNFSNCPLKALDWSIRSYRMLEEIARHDADVICLQEVDHFPFLLRSLSSLGYLGRFMPKPDSPCIHIEDNSGPDGCAIFYKKSKFNLKKIGLKSLNVWGVQSNQIILSVMLRSKTTGDEFVAASTHLKARKGPLMANLRNEQGKDIVEHLKSFADGRPIICTGDFNAEPDEPIHKTLTQQSGIKLSSAYGLANSGQEPSYTSWKIRGGVEHKETLDYIFCSQDKFLVKSVLDPIPETEVPENRFPNLNFASDHLSLVADLTLVPSSGGGKY